MFSQSQCRWSCYIKIKIAEKEKKDDGKGWSDAGQRLWAQSLKSMGQKGNASVWMLFWIKVTELLTPPYSPFSLPAACPCRPPRGWTVGIPLGCIELFCSPSYTLHLFKNKKVYKVLHRSICAQWKFQQVMMAILCTRHQLKPCLVLFMISTTPSWQTTACMHTYKDC